MLYYFIVLFRYSAIALLYYFIQLKRIFVAFLAFTYLLSGSGLLLRQHYCMGEFVSAEIDYNIISDLIFCEDCGSDVLDEDVCCSDQLQLVKKEQEQKITTTLELSAAPIMAIAPTQSQYFVSNILCDNCPSTVTELQKPPPKSLPIFLAIRDLRI